MSSFSIVPTAVTVAARLTSLGNPPLGALNVTVKVSSPSTVVSSSVLTVAVPVVAPALIVTLPPVTAVKSVFDIAVCPVSTDVA